MARAERSCQSSWDYLVNVDWSHTGEEAHADAQDESSVADVDQAGLVVGVVADVWDNRQLRVVRAEITKSSDRSVKASPMKMVMRRPALICGGGDDESREYHGGGNHGTDHRTQRGQRS